MPIKIRNFGGPIIWQLRKLNSQFTSKVMLTFASEEYKKFINYFRRYLQIHLKFQTTMYLL